MSARLDGASDPVVADDSRGRIIFSRFLERPLASFERLVQRTDGDLVAMMFHDAERTLGIVPSVLPNTAWETRSTLPSRALATVETLRGAPTIRYRSDAAVREYQVNEGAFDRFLALQDDAGLIQGLRLVARMRLINSRNRLTHAVVSTLVQEQATFLRSGDPADLVPLAQKRVVEILRQPQDNTRRPEADASRVSRVLHVGSLVVGPSEIELGQLCPSVREVHRQIVRDLVRRERARRVAGEIDGPLIDADLARAVGERSGHAISRRVVAFVRKDLGIPSHRARGRRSCYMTATAGFSSLRSAVKSTIGSDAPRAPGVYEIRAEGPGPAYPTGRCPIVYVGSSQDLRKRLLDQVRGDGRNARLAAHLATGRSAARWIVMTKGWRETERRVYQLFVETFGAPPECNRMSP